MTLNKAPAGATSATIPDHKIGGYIEIGDESIKIYLIATLGGKQVSFDGTKTVYVFYTNNTITAFSNPFVRFTLDDGSYFDLSEYGGDEIGSTNYFSDLTFVPDV